MVELSLSQVAEKTGGTILQGSPALAFNRFNIDSRLTQPGELFFAISAERDGHEFIPHAAEKGAAGAVISHKIKSPGNQTSSFALVLVKNSLNALQSLAHKVFVSSQVQIIGITGSIGKTTAKEFTYSLLSQGFRVLKSEGNFNNHLGLPLSLLKLEKHHDLAVLEYGMSAAGEITALTHIAPPDVSVITNIHPVHLEFFNSVREIALAKKEILNGMNPHGTAVVNGDDPLVNEISSNWNSRKISFGLGARHEISAQNIKKMGWEGISFDLSYGTQTGKAFIPFFNEGHLYNFLAAAGVAYRYELPLEQVLQAGATLQAFTHRGKLFTLNNNIRLIDDSYNSNPAALQRALTSLMELPGGRKIAVLGDMLELGKKEIEFHIQAGELAARLGLDLLITIGPLSRNLAEGALAAGMDPKHIYSYPNADEAAQELYPLLQANDYILVKGSRAIKTEKVVTYLKEKG